MAVLRFTKTILLILFSFLATKHLADAQGSSSSCSSQKTCGTCMAASAECRWCSAPDFSNSTRCDVRSSSLSDCSDEYIVDTNSTFNLVRNKPPQNAIPGTSGASGAIQLSPQEINITLRPHQPVQFKLSFRQAEDYPVDMYFIMDASFTMKQYADTLGSFSSQLVEGISKITKDFRLGFGTFVDKTLLPYVSTGPNGLINICSDKCVLPWGFKNDLRLTRNDTVFKESILNIKTAGNLDAPEGGFDAIMQAAACKDSIGWRDQSRKMIVFSTDGNFHYAGDGKLGGVVVPNDGQCHTGSDGLYSESANQDYPSISQLAQKISEKKMNLIFVVPENRHDLYRRLSEHVLGSNVGQLDANSSNVIDIVNQNYQRITSEIELKTESADGVSVSFKVKCPDNSINTIPKCGGLKIGHTVDFNVTVSVDKCPSDKDQRKKTFYIYPVGLTEKLRVNLEVECECDCEKPGIEEQNSAKCNNSGTYECGICTCNRGFYGKNCECGAADLDNEQNDMSCRMTNTSETCQGRGQCECGQCVCSPINTQEPMKRFSGRFCECNDYNCPYYQDIMCGGRGNCSCGKCQCQTGYSGDACDCSTKTEQCMTKQGIECNGKGKCNCGVCECTLDNSFKGPTCEDCPTCPGQCEQHSFCVECMFRESGHQCHDNCSKVQFVTSLGAFSDANEWRSCAYHHNDSCITQFAYNYKNNDVKVKKEKDCPYRVSNTVIILSVIGAVIAIGIIALLVWKIVVTIYDRREYTAFVNEQKNARWETAVNPLYKTATTDYQNPTYRAENR